MLTDCCVPVNTCGCPASAAPPAAHRSRNLSICRPGVESQGDPFELRPRISTRQRGSRTSAEFKTPKLQSSAPPAASKASAPEAGRNPYKLFSDSDAGSGSIASSVAAKSAAGSGSAASASPYAAFAAGSSAGSGTRTGSTRAPSAPASPYEAFAGAGAGDGGIRAPSAASPYEVFARSSAGSDSLARSSGPDIYAAFSRSSFEEGSPAAAAPVAAAAAVTATASARPAAAAAAAGSRKLGTARGDVRRSSLKKQGAEAPASCAAHTLQNTYSLPYHAQPCVPSCLVIMLLLQCGACRRAPLRATAARGGRDRRRQPRRRPTLQRRRRRSPPCQRRRRRCIHWTAAWLPGAGPCPPVTAPGAAAARASLWMPAFVC